MKAALVTCERFRDLTADDGLLAEALARYSIDARPAVWNDASEDWTAYQCAIVRSTWDYFLYPSAFERWIDDVSAHTRLINPPRLMHWNMHKRYLFGLERAGVRIVPTMLIPKGTELALQSLLREIGTDEFVLKPAISASANRTYVFARGHRDASTAPELLRTLTRDGDALAQPFLWEVYDPGESSLVFVAGSFSHALRRPPLSRGAAGGERREVRIIPSQDEMFAAHAALETLPEVPLYARVDLLSLRSGAVAITELELIEPALYFLHNPACADALANAIAHGITV